MSDLEVKIEFTGPQGAGKTILANYIYGLLDREGIRVRSSPSDRDVLTVALSDLERQRLSGSVALSDLERQRLSGSDG